MNRRTFLKLGVGTALSSPLLAAVRQEKFDAAAGVLAKASADGRIHASSLCVRHGKEVFARAFGAAKSPDAPFLLASITKTVTAAAVMTLYDREKFQLHDPVVKF